MQAGIGSITGWFHAQRGVWHVLAHDAAGELISDAGTGNDGTATRAGAWRIGTGADASVALYSAATATELPALLLRAVGKQCDIIPDTENDRADAWRIDLSPLQRLDGVWRQGGERQAVHARSDRVQAWLVPDAESAENTTGGTGALRLDRARLSGTAANPAIIVLQDGEHWLQWRSQTIDITVWPNGELRAVTVSNDGHLQRLSADPRASPASAELVPESEAINLPGYGVWLRRA